MAEPTSKKMLASLSELWRARRDLCITLIIFGAALALFATDWFRELQYDGVSTVGAERVLRGEIPYRDFWTMYAPGHFYLLALVFLVFGPHLLAEVVAASVISAAAIRPQCSAIRLVSKSSPDSRASGGSPCAQ